jgi:hypothetical protein
MSGVFFFKVFHNPYLRCVVFLPLIQHPTIIYIYPLIWFFPKLKKNLPGYNGFNSLGR